MNRFSVLLRFADQLYGRKKIGQILVNGNHLTQAELDDALHTQKNDPFLRRLGYILIEKGFCPPTDVMSALIQQLTVCVPHKSP